MPLIDAIGQYWPHIVLIVSLIAGAAAASHAVMTKEDVRAATGWVGIIVFSPLLGAFVYLIGGINRIRRSAMTTRRAGGRRVFEKRPNEHRLPFEVIDTEYGRRFRSLATLGDNVTRFHLTSGNTIAILETGDEAYAEIVRAIDGARDSIFVESYIFDCDEIGRRIADRLLAAQTRGVTVRILIDAVGARYSVPSIIGYFRTRGLHARTFNGNVIMGLRLPYANLRTHRKIIIVDDALAFTGGMNIRQGFAGEYAGDQAARDTHFKVTGPVVADLHTVVAEDWSFATGEAVESIHYPVQQDGAPVPTYVRVVSSGPDVSVETNHRMLLGAISVARHTIRIMSPYFLPDRELVSAIATAAQRGVRIDIVVPLENNLQLVDMAMTAQFDQVLKHGCHVWRVSGTFNHSKLIAIDGRWSYVGSSNLDPRSLRLNFEVDLEVLDPAFAAAIAARIDAAIALGHEVTLHSVRNRPFPLRLIEKFIWLGSPYL